MRNNNVGKTGKFLTILGISIGVASVMIISEIGRLGIYLAEKEILNMSFNLIMISSNKEYIDSPYLDDDTINQINNSFENMVVSPLTVNYSKSEMRGLTANSGIIGSDENINKIFPMQLVSGRMFNNNDVEQYKRVCVIDEKMAEDYYHRKNIIGKTVKIKINGIEEKYKVIGIVKSGGSFLHNIIKAAAPYIVYVPYTCIQQITKTNSFNNIVLKLLNETDNIENYTFEIDNLLNKNYSYKPFCVSNMASQGKSIYNMLNNIKSIFSGIAGISLVVSGMNIMTVMLIRIKEQMFEIGIKKTIGARNAIIVKEFTVYACSMALKGILYGLMISETMIFILSDYFHIKYTFDLITIVKVTLTTFLITIIFSAYPTWKVALLKPINALNQEI